MTHDATSGPGLSAEVVADQPGPARRTRADGEQSRTRILDAAAHVAGERGYEGTSISLVSALCRLSASSIYWHFPGGKDELLAAVVERSFNSWLCAMTLPGPEVGDAQARLRRMADDIGVSLREHPDFLRLGLMLALERRPEQLAARTVFLQVRRTAHTRLVDAVSQLLPGLTDADAQALATYSMAVADGLFVAEQIDPESADLLALLDLHACAVIKAAQHLLAGGDGGPAAPTIGEAA